MSKTAYHISLKGYVGGYDFDRSTVDSTLAKNEGKAVNVLIDSLCGSLATGLSISAAFKNHGNVNVHFVGLNASAATIASLGAAHISLTQGQCISCISVRWQYHTLCDCLGVNTEIILLSYALNISYNKYFCYLCNTLCKYEVGVMK